MPLSTAPACRPEARPPIQLPPFDRSEPLTLGVELELQIVDLQQFDLHPAVDALLAQVGPWPGPGEVKLEITRSMVEVSTGVCADARQALAELQVLRDALVQAADRLGIGLCGGGTHPFQQWPQRQITDTPRHRQVAALYGYLAQQFTVFGQHVHVGVRDGDEALVLLQRLSLYVPHLIALAASSPWVQSVDTGFASSRLNAVQAFPMSGRAPLLSSWSAFEDHFHRLARTGIVSSMKDLYWDIRPKPEFGTVEVRVMDTPLTVERAAALAGFVQCLARWCLNDGARPVGEDDLLAYTYNRFQAARFGLDGTLADAASDGPVRLRDSLSALLPRLRPHAQDLRAEAALDEVAGVLQHGNDADHLRRMQAAGETLPAVVAQQRALWRGSPHAADPCKPSVALRSPIG
jgi:carboxylate-amine ligase